LGLSLARAFSEAMGWRLSAAIIRPGVLAVTLSSVPTAT
jgi:hypothetical protein